MQSSSNGDGKLIISVKEARKLMGRNAKNLSDEEVEKAITDLDFIARMAIRDYLEKLRKDTSSTATSS